MHPYLFKMILCSGILYAYYFWVQRNQKMHDFNRYYLLGSLGISLLLPLFSFTVNLKQAEWPQKLQAVYYTVEDNIVVSTKASTSFSMVQIIYLIGAVISAILVCKLIYSFYRLIEVKKKSHPQKEQGLLLIMTKHPAAPFSFFRWLFWQQEIDLHSQMGQQIWRHELYHIQAKHSWDLLFVELLICVFWFNPFLYAYRKEIKTVQEFQADAFASNDIDSEHYAKLLLWQAISGKTAAIITPFFHHQLKRRIAMLSQIKKTKNQAYRKMTVAPIVLLLIVFISCNFIQESKEHAANSSEKDSAKIIEVTLAEDGKQEVQTHLGETQEDASNTIGFNIAEKESKSAQPKKEE